MKTHRPIPTFVRVAPLLVSFVSGCATTGLPPPETSTDSAGENGPDRPEPTPESAHAPPAPTPENIAPGWNPRSAVIVDTNAGQTAAWADLVAHAANADVVLLGEIHGHPRVQAVMAALFADVIALDTRNPALSLEFFARDQQVAVDDYLTHVTDTDGFQKAAHTNDKNYPPGHRAMLEAAREHHLLVCASNAPRRYVKIARTEGLERLEALTEYQRSLFVIPSYFVEGDYWERFSTLMSRMAEHMGEGEQEGDKEELVRAFFVAQNLWDATMADSVVGLLDRGAGPVFHVVGKFHVEFDAGLVQRVRDAAPGRSILTVTFFDQDPGDLEGPPPADYVVFVGSSEDDESGEGEPEGAESNDKQAAGKETGLLRD